MTALKKDAEKHPIYHTVIIVLFALGITSMPLTKLFALFIKNSYACTLLGGITADLIAVVCGIVAIKKYQFIKIFRSFSWKGFLICLPAFLVCVNNFPLLTLFSGGVTFTANCGESVLYAAFCLITALSEQIVFSGLVFPLMTVAYKKKKHKKIFSILTTACIFSLSHLINLFSGASVGTVFMQVCYTFLTGLMFTCIFVFSKNVFIPVIYHFVYDFGGLMLNGTFGIGVGSYWQTTGIILTVIIGVLVGVYFLIMTLLLSKKEITKEGLDNE